MDIKSVRILVVEDEELLCHSIVDFLKSEGFNTYAAMTAEEAMKYVAAEEFSLVLTDITLPGKSGSELLEYIITTSPATPVIVMTAFGSLDLAIEMIKRGAYYYLSKPIRHEDLSLLIRHALEEDNNRDEVRYLKSQIQVKSQHSDIIYRSKIMEELMKKIEKFSKVDSPVLITGENGTGKDMVARMLHEKNSRSKRRFVAVNCASFQETLLESELFGHEKGAFTSADSQKRGLLEIADGGTLFLDEVGEIPMSIQAKFLHFIEHKSFRRVGGTRDIHVDVRILSATNRDLESAINKQQFRSDLFFRLHVLSIHLPPLRERLQDIPLIVKHFLKRLCLNDKRIIKLSDEAMNKLMMYTWPGNIRQLQNVIEQAVCLRENSTIEPGDIALPIKDILLSSISSNGHDWTTMTFKEAKNVFLSDFERNFFISQMKKNKGHIGRAAEASCMDRKNFSQKLEKYGITKENFKTKKEELENE